MKMEWAFWLETPRYLREDGKGSGPEVREQKSISQVKEGKIDHNLKRRSTLYWQDAW